MKKQILLPFLLLCIGITAQQTHFGVKGGYSLSTISVKSDVGKFSYDPTSSFYLGTLAEHSLHDKFSVQAELLYSNIGGTYKATQTVLLPDVGIVEVNIEDKISYGTLQLPLLGKYNVSDNFSLTTGINFGLIVSAKYKTKDLNGLEVENNIKKDVNTLDISPLLGLEYNLKNKIFFDTRYHFGVSNISKISASKQTINFLQVGIGYKFN